MGAGYDGHVIIWDVSCFTESPQNLFDLFGEQDWMHLLIEEPGTDVTSKLVGWYLQIWEGHLIKVYDIREYNLVDGNFSP